MYVSAISGLLKVGIDNYITGTIKSKITVIKTSGWTVGISAAIR
jgi:hypothetical protein